MSTVSDGVSGEKLLFFQIGFVHHEEKRLPRVYISHHGVKGEVGRFWLGDLLTVFEEHPFGQVCEGEKCPSQYPIDLLEMAEFLERHADSMRKAAAELCLMGTGENKETGQDA